MEVMLTNVPFEKKTHRPSRGIFHYLYVYFQNKMSPSSLSVESLIKLQYKNKKLQLQLQAPTTTQEALNFYNQKNEYYNHQLLELAKATDYKSQIKALVLHKLHHYIKRIIINLQVNNPEHHTPQLQWSVSRVGLVELLYAFHAMGAFNNGTASLTDIAKLLESSFNIPLGQFHRAYIEIKDRKMERTKFLKQLTEALLQKIDNDEAK
jgi:hypothetical protein